MRCDYKRPSLIIILEIELKSRPYIPVGQIQGILCILSAFCVKAFEMCLPVPWSIDPARSIKDRCLVAYRAAIRSKDEVHVRDIGIPGFLSTPSYVGCGMDKEYICI
jgi:hypothetical protein